MTRTLLQWAVFAAVLGGLAFTVTAYWSPWDEVRELSPDGVQIQEPGHFSAVRNWIPQLTVRLVRDGIAWAVDDHYLFVSADSGRTFERRGAIPKVDASLVDLVRNRIARHPLVRRIRENRGPSSVAVLASGTILLFYDRIYRSVDGGWTFEALPRIDDQVYPPFPHGVAVDNEDRVYFGDYRNDARPHSVRVYRGSDDGSRWEVCHVFESGEVFHVHSVAYDPFADQVLVATGDRDRESWLFELDPGCEEVRPVEGGSQRWRLLAPIFREDAMFWGNDDDSGGSAIFERHRSGNEVIERFWTGNPSYHSSLLSSGAMGISTTYEPRSPWTREANPSPHTEVWISEHGDQWHLLDRHEWNGQEKSWGPARAVTRLPTTDGSLPYLFTSPKSTVEPFGTYRYRINWETSP